jgi:hypothetical protein
MYLWMDPNGFCVPSALLAVFCTIAVALSTGPHAVRQARKAAKQDMPISMPKTSDRGVFLLLWSNTSHPARFFISVRCCREADAERKL